MDHSDSSPAKSLDISITESFFPLDGPILRLPNELMQSILARLNLQDLIPMQAVCKIWQAVIYSIGHTKKSLFVTDLGYPNRDYDKPKDIKEPSFGQIDSNVFTCIKIKRRLYSFEHFPSKLVELCIWTCPIVEQLVLRLLRLSDIHLMLQLFLSNQVTTLSIMFQMYETVINPDRVTILLDRINLCTSLKILDIWVSFELLSTLAPTFARLKHFSCRSPYSGKDIIAGSNKEVVITLVRHFGPNCSSVNLRCYGFTDCSQWHTINGQWLAQVTHLELQHILDEPGQAIRTLCEHAVLLKVLRLSFLGNNFFGSSLTSQMIGNLSKLQHLTELYLRCFFIELTHLEEAALSFQFTPLVSIRIFSLEMTGFIGGSNMEHSNIDQFTSILSTIVPNVQHLSVESFVRLEGVEQYLTRFAQLQTHSFLP